MECGIQRTDSGTRSAWKRIEASRIQMRRGNKNTSEILQIILHPTSPKSDIDELERLIQESHALFSSVFFRDRSSAYCFTPSTHNLLHFPSIMRNCGPLANVSQFLAEELSVIYVQWLNRAERPRQICSTSLSLCSDCAF